MGKTRQRRKNVTVRMPLCVIHVYLLMFYLSPTPFMFYDKVPLNSFCHPKSEGMQKPTVKGRNSNNIIQQRKITRNNKIKEGMKESGDNI